jgi:hypothetical protein
MSRIDNTVYVTDPTCGCGHGRSLHYKHDDCTGCKSDFCHSSRCFCESFAEKTFKWTPETRARYNRINAKVGNRRRYRTKPR